MEQIQNLSVISESNLISAGDFTEKNNNLNDQELVNALAENCDNESLILGGLRDSNFWTTHIFNLRNSKVTKEFGEFEIDVPFLSFHIPPEGNGQLILKSNSQTGVGFNLSIMGTGYGSGKNTSFSINTDFGNRQNCFSLQNKLLIQIKEVELTRWGRKKTILRTDVIRVVDYALNSHKICPWCNNNKNKHNHNFHADFPAVNLKNDPSGISQSKTVKMKEFKNFSFGLDIEAYGLKMSPSLNIDRSIESECLIDYHFPGGFCYQAITSKNPFKDLPFWRRE